MWTVLNIAASNDLFQSSKENRRNKQLDWLSMATVPHPQVVNYAHAESWFTFNILFSSANFLALSLSTLISYISSICNITGIVCNVQIVVDQILY